MYSGGVKRLAILAILTGFVVMHALSLAQPAPTLFDTPWDERTLFAGDLTDASVLEPFNNANLYHLSLELSDDLSSGTGSQEVLITNRTGFPFEDLVLRLYPNVIGSEMTVSAVRVDGEAASFVLEGERSVLRVLLPDALRPGESLVLGADFALEVSEGTEQSYGRLARYENVLSLAHAYPVVAVFEEGTWDTALPPSLADPLFAESSFFLVHVHAPTQWDGKEVTLVATGRELARELVGDRQELLFAAGPARDFYLTASLGYVEQSLTIDDTTLHAYAPVALSEGAWRGLEIAADALRVFERRFGPYPYRELDIVAVPVSAGGIEFPGVFNVADRYFGEPEGFFETIVAHETAHQWFFGLVGNDQVTEPWLDESLTQYATLLYFEDIYGEARADAFRRYLEGNWRNASRRDLPVGLPAEAYTPRDYSAIVYGRGALFFEALAEEVGREVLDETLTDYAQTYAWRLADTAGFQAVAEARCGCDLSRLFDTWIHP